MELNPFIVYILLFVNGVFSGLGSFLGQFIGKRVFQKIKKNVKNGSGIIPHHTKKYNKYTTINAKVVNNER